MKIVPITLILLFLSTSLFAKEVNELYSDSDAWNELIARIVRGDKEAIIKAIELRKESDAGASSELNDALFVALQYEPELVLNTKYNICFGRSDPLSTYKSAVDELNKVIESVSEINSDRARECVANLQNSKTSLDVFFGIK